MPQSVWDPEQFWLKATVYVGRVHEASHDRSAKPFWSILALEFLARGALTNVHPALNADPQDVENLLHALGLEHKGEPRSIPIHAVLLRLERVLPEFDKPTREFCDFLMIIRNRELHTSELPLESLSEADWLPRYYRASKILCDSLGRSLAELFGEEESQTASKLIEALESNIISEVKKKISAHAQVYGQKGDEEKDKLKQEQALLSQAWRDSQIPRECPACHSVSKLKGEIETVSDPFFEEDQLLVERVFVATRLECSACDLVLKDINEIHHAGIDPHFTRRNETELHEWFEPDYYDEYNNM